MTDVDVPGRTSRSRLQKFLAVTVAVLALLALVFGLATALDRVGEHQRVLYRDVLTMARLQYDQVRLHGKAVPADVEGGESVTIDGHRFTTSPGVRVRAKKTDDGYCVRGWNDHGDVTAWVCGNGDKEPPPLGALARLD